jgi:hypothetical protein
MRSVNVRVAPGRIEVATGLSRRTVARWALPLTFFVAQRKRKIQYPRPGSRLGPGTTTASQATVDP